MSNMANLMPAFTERLKKEYKKRVGHDDVIVSVYKHPNSQVRVKIEYDDMMELYHIWDDPKTGPSFIRIFGEQP